MGRRPAAFRYARKTIKGKPHFLLYDYLVAMYRVKGDAQLTEKYVNLAKAALKKEGH